MIKKYNNINNENAIILHLIKMTPNKKVIDEFNNNIIHLTILKGNPCLLFNILNELSAPSKSVVNGKFIFFFIIYYTNIFYKYFYYKIIKIYSSVSDDSLSSNDS